VIERRIERDGVLVAVLNRPPANAIDDQLLDDLEAVVSDVAADGTIRALVIAAAGPFFCGGFDLRASRRDPDAVAAMVRRYRSAHRNLLALGKPTVAAVHGHAIAGGLVLALACDRCVFADGDYKIGLNEVAIGAAFPAAAMEIVRLRLTTAAVAELVLEARLLEPADAVRLGVVPELHPVGTALDGAVTLATRLGAYPQVVYAHAKEQLVHAALARIDAVSFDTELATAHLWEAEESRAARRLQRARLEGRSE